MPQAISILNHTSTLGFLSPKLFQPSLSTPTPNALNTSISLFSHLSLTSFSLTHFTLEASTMDQSLPLQPMFSSALQPQLAATSVSTACLSSPNLTQSSFQSTNFKRLTGRVAGIHLTPLQAADYLAPDLAPFIHASHVSPACTMQQSYKTQHKQRNYFSIIAKHYHERMAQNMQSHKPCHAIRIDFCYFAKLEKQFLKMRL
jgi:hypothetical protein